MKLLLKNWKELEYVLYMLDLKDEECKRWAGRMEIIIRDQKKLLKEKKGDFTPKYIDYCEKKIEMKKDGAELQTAVGITSLMFSS